MERSLLIVCGLLAGVGCGLSMPELPGSNGSEMADGITPSPQPGVTWHLGIQPIVERTCARCHGPGGLAPGDYSKYEEVAPIARAIAHYVNAGLMPPPAADPTCADYVGSEFHHLTDAERGLITQWAELGAPEGHVVGSRSDTQAPATLLDDDADFILYPREPHYPTFDAGGDDYHCSVLDLGNDGPLFATAMDVRIDKPEMVHHVVAYLDDGGVDYGGEGGFQCFHPEADWTLLSAWAPGTGATFLPPGTGLKLEPGSRIILQVHYFESFDGAALTPDRSGYALKTAPAVEEELLLIPFGPSDFVIPAGAAEHTETKVLEMDGSLPPLTIWGVFPHMHGLGTGYALRVTDRLGGSQCVLKGPGFDFHNQLIYFLKEPVGLAYGDSLSFTCTWDNSGNNPNQGFDPPQDIPEGEGTLDEMCIAFGYVTHGH